MASPSWTWKDYWSWFRQIEVDADRTTAMRELLHDGWLKSLSAEIQAEVMVDAPIDILRDIIWYLPDVLKVDAVAQIEHKLKARNKRRKH